MRRLGAGGGESPTRYHGVVHLQADDGVPCQDSGEILCEAGVAGDELCIGWLAASTEEERCGDAGADNMALRRRRRRWWHSGGGDDARTEDLAGKRRVGGFGELPVRSEAAAAAWPRVRRRARARAGTVA